MNEEKLDRRVHWLQLLTTGLVAATVFCVKIQMGLNQAEDDFRQYRKEMKILLKEYDTNIDDLTHRVIILETERACGG